MKVTAGGLAYEVDFAVTVGDWLLLPDTGFKSGNWEAKVTRLSADYDGYCKRAIANHGNDAERAKREVCRLEDEGRRVRSELKGARERLAALAEGTNKR